MGTRSLLTKVRQEKNLNKKKTRRCPTGNQISYRTVEFFLLRFFFLVNFCEKTPAGKFSQGHSTKFITSSRKVCVVLYSWPRTKQLYIKINYLYSYVLTRPLKRKLHADPKNDLKKSDAVFEGHKLWMFGKIKIQFFNFVLGKVS